MIESMKELILRKDPGVVPILAFALPVLFFCFLMFFCTPNAFPGEIEDLAMQHRKLQALKQYHEGRLEQIVVDMSVIQQRYELARKQLMEKKDEKTPADKPDPAAGH